MWVSNRYIIVGGDLWDSTRPMGRDHRDHVTSRDLAPLAVKFHHADVIIPRGEEGRAREFYCGVLGLVEIDKPEVLKPNGGLWLLVGDVQIHLSVQDGCDPATSKAHLAYEVEDLAAVKSTVSGNGFLWRDNMAIPGYLRGDIRDPFGNRIEFLQRNQSPRW